MDRIKKRRGLICAIARELNLSWQTVSGWKRVPLEHVFRVAVIANLKPEALRPEFFADDPVRQ